MFDELRGKLVENRWIVGVLLAGGHLSFNELKGIIYAIALREPLKTQNK